MKKHSKAQTTLTVHGGDSLTKISIIDKNFNKVATGLGFLSEKLDPGIYKIRSQTATTSEHRLIEVTGREEGGNRSIFFNRQSIQSAVPLADTVFPGKTFQQSDIKKLHDISFKKPEIGATEDCRLLIHLRDDEMLENEFLPHSISIHTADGSKLADFSNGYIDADNHNAGVAIGVKAGVYRLRVETGPLGEYEVFLCAAEGWQTQVFLANGSFYSGSIKFRRPMLRTSSVLMARLGQPFTPDNQDARLAELALQALIKGYNILEADDMRNLLQGKFEDPMLGIYGAHLLLQRTRINWDVFHTICKNLEHLVGPVPDVQALFVKSKISFDSPEKRIEVYRGMPPLLIRSWDLLVKQSQRKYTAIPMGSLADRVSMNVVSSKPWLICRVTPETEIIEQDSFAVSREQSSRIVQQMIEATGPATLAEITKTLDEEGERLNSIELAILQTVQTLGKKRKKSENVSEDPGFLTVSNLDGSFRQSADIAKDVFSSVSAPSYSVARSAASLAAKLKKKFDFDL